MNLMGRLRAIERRSGLTGPCRSCLGRGGGGWFSMRGNEPAPERPCPRCGKLGPPSKVIRIVYRSEEQTEGGAES